MTFTPTMRPGSWLTISTSDHNQKRGQHSKLALPQEEGTPQTAPIIPHTIPLLSIHRLQRRDADAQNCHNHVKECQFPRYWYKNQKMVGCPLPPLHYLLFCFQGKKRLGGGEGRWRNKISSKDALVFDGRFLQSRSPYHPWPIRNPCASPPELRLPCPTLHPGPWKNCLP